jgi:hypothetical protein
MQGETTSPGMPLCFGRTTIKHTDAQPLLLAAGWLSGIAELKTTLGL